MQNWLCNYCVTLESRIMDLQYSKEAVSTEP